MFNWFKKEKRKNLTLDEIRQIQEEHYAGIKRAEDETAKKVINFTEKMFEQMLARIAKRDYTPIDDDNLEIVMETEYNYSDIDKAHFVRMGKQYGFNDIEIEHERFETHFIRSMTSIWKISVDISKRNSSDDDDFFGGLK